MKTLVTADLAGVWGSDSAVVLLGEWCRPPAGASAIEGREIEAIPYHWNDRQKLHRDFERLNLLNERLLQDMAPCFNRLHGVHEDIRFWRLLLGYWLSVFTTVLFDRWSSLERARRVTGLRTYLYPVDDESLSAADTPDFIKKATESQDWNHALYCLLLQRIPEIEKVSLPASPIRCIDNGQRSPRPGGIARRLYRRIVCPLKRHDDYFLTSTYLSRGNQIELEARLGQFPLPQPQIASAPAAESTFRPHLREWRLSVEQGADDFDVVVRELLPKFVPTTFLEGFAALMKTAECLPWPVSPKVIFTSNRHFSDDAFKAWAASKIKRGARMVIGEHGGYGTGLFNGGHTYQLSVADRFITTGWGDPHDSRIAAAGDFRRSGRRVMARPDGKGILVCGIMPKFAFELRAMALSSQVVDYFEDQFRFMAALPEALRPQILVRLVAADYGWDQKARWLERFPGAPLDGGDRPIWKVAAECRLFISTYNATTYIESFSHNFPTVMFWDPTRWELKPEAKPYFERLKAAGVFHETPESAAAHVAGIWNDVSGWWQSGAVQEARAAFCDAYVSAPDNIVGRLAGLLREESRLSATAS